MDYFIQFEDGSEGYLAHHGVLGMKWGVRNAETRARYRRDGTSKSISFRINRKAKKDAKEFAEAKMYYGQGAGTRRKLIKNKVEQRSKDLPGYSEAFGIHLDNQDMGKAVSKAKRKRARTDAVDATRKTGRGVIHAMNGNSRYASAGALAVIGVAKLTGADKRAAQYAAKGASRIFQLFT